jgi:hypothetical protein
VTCTKKGDSSTSDCRIAFGYGIPPMSWNKDGELDAKACRPLIEQLWGSYAVVIAERQDTAFVSWERRS